MLKRSLLLNGRPDLWGGFECTINRVGDTYRDQLEETGYYDRRDNIEVLHSLGVKACRYPILWERFEIARATDHVWAFAHRELEALRKFSIEPIIGLLHHGSGPRHTQLDDPNFPQLFAQYAGRVAQEIPDATYYTPINEPLTTARFSGLYGFWFPHETDALCFVRMLLSQIKATVLAMQEIRQVNPHAKLIQTEDLGKVHSTSLLQYQADFENTRRWLTFDLLCGRVDEEHPLWGYLLSIGIRVEELAFFLENTCPPDVLGLNYYVTSERYLDERWYAYPHISPGGNGQHKYVDTEAYRAGAADGIRQLLTEAWQRYKLPLAVSEVHLGCTREEQMRWFHEVWNAVRDGVANGVQIEAVTTWAVSGSVDWSSLVTRREGNYESGAFDIRQGLRRTALADMIASLGNGDSYDHPLLQNSGWWNGHQVIREEQNRQPLLIMGKYGSLASALVTVCKSRGIWCESLSRNDIDLSEMDNIMEWVERLNPWGIVNACGLSSIDDAENRPAVCYSLNAMYAANLAKVCAIRSLPYLTFSSDQVFDGEKRTPYDESDRVSPINCFGASKALAEMLVSFHYPKALIIRTSAPFSPWDNSNFAQVVLAALQDERIMHVANDTTVSPTYIPHLLNASLDLFIDGEKGIWHLYNRNSELTWCEFALTLARCGGYHSQIIVGTESHHLKGPARRPSNSALVSARGELLPSLDVAIADYLQEVKNK